MVRIPWQPFAVAIWVYPVFALYAAGPGPEIALNRSQLNFGAASATLYTGPQQILILNSGGSPLSWTANSDQPWLVVNPESGTGSYQITVTVDPTGLANGSYSGSVTVSDPSASNSPQTVAVELVVYPPGSTNAPFGEFATPLNGSTVRGTVPFTGWVLDDIGIQNVGIFREDMGPLIFLGNAILVEGARPDILAAYPNYPLNYQAGWVYSLLSPILPNGGNGTFTIHALATDIEGNQVTLGTKTVTLDNANAVKPFGMIDLPQTGGVASGNSFNVFGWVLTPLPNMIPIDGSTLNLYIDGAPLPGHPAYNIFRADIANLFPGYANSNGAGWVMNIDTTTYENGIHTMVLTATDNAGNTDGIGSRFFEIYNEGATVPVELMHFEVE